MLELFQEIEKKMQAQESCVVAVVIDSRGSVPRGAGAVMLVTAAGRCWGTIGGGPIEYEATKRAQRLALEGRTSVEHFDMSIKSNAMCGGAYDVLLYALDWRKPELCAAVAQLLEQAQKQEAFQLLLPLAGGLPLVSRAATLSGCVELEGKPYYAQAFQTDGSVYIFGGGHVAQELVPVLAHLDFRCIVMDDREEFANKQRFPQAAEVRTVDYASLEGVVHITAQDYVLIMTRGHSCDTEAERFALKTEAKYIGLMGSKTKKKLTRAKLLAEGYTPEQLARVIIPVGLEIKSETPAEIAISIAAQLIEQRAQRSSGSNKYRV